MADKDTVRLISQLTREIEKATSVENRVFIGTEDSGTEENSWTWGEEVECGIWIDDKKIYRRTLVQEVPWTTPEEINTQYINITWNYDLIWFDLSHCLAIGDTQTYNPYIQCDSGETMHIGNSFFWLYTQKQSTNNNQVILTLRTPVGCINKIIITVEYTK